MEPNLHLQAAEEEDKVYTMAEVLKEEEKLVGDANAVFGDAESNACMFNMGYIRQVLYVAPGKSTHYSSF